MRIVDFRPFATLRGKGDASIALPPAGEWMAIASELF
jgi:hypothetical protein